MTENNYFCLRLSKDEKTVELTVHTTSRERAIILYEGLEKVLSQLTQADLMQPDNPEKRSQ
jgi:hypothetical protein